MRTLKILKTENEVMELSIANALFYILQENDIESKLINKSAMYLIEIYGEIEYQDLFFPEIQIEDINNINSSMTRKEQESMLNKTLELLDSSENLEGIFNYYETFNEEILSKSLKKSDGALFVGTYSYTKGVRGYGSAGGCSHKIPIYKKVLAFLGFIQSTNFLNIKDVIQINSLLEPKETDIFLMAEYITYEDKETGESKPLRIISKKEPKVFLLAALYILNLQKLSEEEITSKYKSIWLMQAVPTANKPLSDKIIKLPVHNLTVGLLNELYKKLTYSTVDRDVKMALSEYLLIQNSQNYIDMIKVFSKNNEKIMDNHLEELINLQNNTIKEFYENETVKILGRGLNRLIRDKKGYTIQVKLLNCISPNMLEGVIRDLCMLYLKNYKSYLLNDEDYRDLMAKAKDINTVKSIATNIITYASIYIKPKEDKEEVKEGRM